MTIFKGASSIQAAQSSGFRTSRYIHLNVGGMIYMTSQETLTRYQESMLGNMFLQEKIPLARDDQGRFLIDRDGKLFRQILNFLRDGELDLPEEPREYNQLLKEASFYGLDELVKRMCIHLNVNGVHYTTTKMILTQHEGSLLTQIFSKKRIPLNRDQEGRYLLKGDGHLFQYVLHFLEDDDLHLPGKFERFAELEKEGQHYRLEAIGRALTVRLNVGGHEFSARRADLIKVKGSLLEEIFTKTPISLERDQIGRFVIHRAGNTFQYILNYLKNGKLQLPDDKISHREFEADLDYYKLEEIRFSIRVRLFINYTYQEIAWKNLTKYKGSLLEEKFADAKIRLGKQHDLQVDNVHCSVFYYIITFLETGNLAEVSEIDYPKLLQLARHLRLEELQRQLNDRQ